MLKFKTSIIGLCLFAFLAINSAYAASNMYGSFFDDKIPVISIVDVYNSSDLHEQVYSFEGEITARCASNGCWFKIEDGTAEVLIDLKPYDFRLPEDVVGKKVKINGKVNIDNESIKIDAISVIVYE